MEDVVRLYGVTYKKLKGATFNMYNLMDWLLKGNLVQIGDVVYHMYGKTLRKMAISKLADPVSGVWVDAVSFDTSDLLYGCRVYCPVEWYDDLGAGVICQVGGESNLHWLSVIVGYKDGRFYDCDGRVYDNARPIDVKVLVEHLNQIGYRDE